MQVSLPGLHITLGIYYRLFTLLETECRSLDCLLVACSRGELVGAGPSFEDHVATMTERKALREVADKLQNEAEELEGLVTWFCTRLEDPDTNPQIHILCNEVTKKRRGRESGIYYIYIQLTKSKHQ